MKKIINLMVLILIQVALFAQENPEQKKIKWLEGNWEGTGYQIDNKTWSVRFNHADKKFTVSYPSLGCSGWWKLEQANGTHLVFTENITVNNGCDQGGKVVVTQIDENNISVAWFLPDTFGERAIAFTVLLKIAIHTEN